MWKFKILKIITLATVGIGALGWLVMSLWNWLVPTLFTTAHPIDFVQALGLLVLCKILFGGFGGKCGHKHHCHPRHGEKLSPDEREKFMHRWFCCKKDQTTPEKI